LARKRKLYIAVLDGRDWLGCVSLQLMAIHLGKLGVPVKLKILILDSYEGTTFRIMECRKGIETNRD
jgi:hypothetical protein